jgi:hypothetical protein
MISVVSFSFGMAQSSIYTSVLLAIFEIDIDDLKDLSTPMNLLCKSNIMTSYSMLLECIVLYHSHAWTDLGS